jgi:hypothetical protein
LFIFAQRHGLYINVRHKLKTDETGKMTTDKQVKTLEDAKRYFISMGCSHFNLDREDFDRAKEYRSLKISTETESLWRREEFDRQLSNFTNNGKEKFGLAFFCLTDLIETNDYYIQQLYDLTKAIVNNVSGKPVINLLTSIIGNDSTKTHGGLVQKSNALNRLDIRDGFISIALTLIEKAEMELLEITFIRGNLADIIEHYIISDLFEISHLLRTKDDIEALKYYEDGASEGNKFSMKMLAKYYRSGKGCKPDLDKAKYWEQKEMEQ